jgi:hypothetical protein
MEPADLKAYEIGSMDDMKVTRLSERDLELELFGKKTQNEQIDAFEEQSGRKKKKQKKINIKNKVRIFDLDKPNHAKAFEGLMNNSRYRITKMLDNFSHLGSYKVVCYYWEDLDSKEPPVTLNDDEETPNI